MKKKLPAFTLMELLIGMIISSIVISFGYGAYSLVYKQYLSYKKIKNEIVEVTQLNTILYTDLVKAELVSFNENELAIDRKNNSPLLYDFNNSIVLRKDVGVIDTFKIEPAIITASFVFADQKALVNAFSFEAKVWGETEHFVFEKKYSAETLMNYENKFKK
jgi:prepilin-type N-terminal cleavage/methylation domain-containing protein